jgi:Tfp pilus assembly protein PilO
VSDQKSVATAKVLAPTALPSVARPPTTTTPRSTSLGLLQRFAARLTGEWLPRLSWHASRTGRPGLIGMALLVATAVFAFSTQVEVTNEVATLRGEVAKARIRAANQPRTPVSDAARALAHLPARADMPALLAVLITQADAAQLSLDTGKYEMTSSKSGDITRYKITLPVAGQYVQIRRFIDATLTALPAASISDLRIQRKTVGDPMVEAQIRLTFYTRSAP